MDEKDYQIALSTFVPFGPARLTLLYSYFNSYENIWIAPKKELVQIGLKESIVESFAIHRKSFNFKEYKNRLNKLNIRVLTKVESEYPDSLKNIPDAPFVLYIKGSLSKNDSEAVAIIGSRKMTRYGSEVALLFARRLSEVGVTIVSGLALGIDTVAHKGALSVEGRTIAVVATGLDSVYPANNNTLSSEIIKNGAILSEYPLGYPALRSNFAQRNRIISGLSKAVVVVEGLKKSGTLLTATHAANQGKTVFAIPGQITSPLSEAPFFLIENGAKIATKPEDILDELNMQLHVDKDTMHSLLPSDELETQICDLLHNEPKQIDEIVRELGLPAYEVVSKLSMMELKGLVKEVDDGIYKKII